MPIAGVFWRAVRFIRECRRGALPRVRSSPSQEMSYRSHWTISEPNDIQTALGRVSRKLQKQQNGFLTLTRRRRDPHRPRQRKMILTNCAACAAPLAHDAPRCVRCWTRYCDANCQHDHWRRGHKQICKKIHRGGNAEQYNADKKYKEAVAVAVEACADDTKGQTCYICTQALGPRRHARRSPRGRDDARGRGTNRAARVRRRAPADAEH